MRIKILFLISLLTIPQICFSQSTLFNGLLAYFPFNGNANDSLKFFQNITVSGAVLTPDKNGNPNSAYLFHGNTDRILSGITANVNTSTLSGLSFSLWFNTSSFTSSTNPRLFIYDGYNSDYDLSIAGNIGSNSSQDVGKPWLINYNGSDNINYKSDSIIKLNTWNQITVVIDQINNITQLFYNGSLTGSSSILIDDATEPVLSIGNHPYANWGFVGTIDEFRVYGRTLNQSEITELYQNYEITTTSGVTTGTANNSVQESPFVVYPNPAQDNLYISYSGNDIDKLQIISPSGNNIQTYPFANQLSLKNLTAGVYLLRAIDGNGNQVANRKIVINDL